MRKILFCSALLQTVGLCSMETKSILKRDLHQRYTCYRKNKTHSVYFEKGETSVEKQKNENHKNASCFTGLAYRQYAFKEDVECCLFDCGQFFRFAIMGCCIFGLGYSYGSQCENCR